MSGPAEPGEPPAPAPARAATATTVVAVAPQDPLDPATFSGYSSRLFSGLRRRGVNVVPLASRDLRWHDLPAALNLAGIARGRIRGRGAPRIRPDWYWSRAGYERFCARLDERLAALPERPTLLQVGTHVRPSVPGTAFYCVTDCTVVQAIEGGEFAISQASPRVAKEAVDCQREVFAACEKVFTLSGWTAQSVIDDYGIPAGRVVVVGAGANLTADMEDTRTGVPALPPRTVDRDAPYVLFVGMDWERKGGPELVGAVELVRRKRPEVRLKVVGCHPQRPGDGVDVIGFLPPGDEAAQRRLFELYSGASALALLSRFDCFPNVLLEAQLLGVPVVTRAGEGRPEEVRDGETGFLVPDDDPRAVADALLRVLDGDETDRLGRAATRHAADRFTWPLVVDRVMREMSLRAVP